MAASTSSGVKPTTSACSLSVSRRSSSEICLSSFGTISFNTLATSVSIALLLLSICLSPLRATTTGTALSALFSKEGMITRLSHGLINTQSAPPARLMIWRVTHSPGRVWGGSLSLTLPWTALVCGQSPLQVTVMSLTCSSAVLVTKSTRMYSSTGRLNGRKAAKNSTHPERNDWNIRLPLQFQCGGFVSRGMVLPCGPIAGFFSVQQGLLTGGGVSWQFEVAAIFSDDRLRLVTDDEDACSGDPKFPGVY